MTTIETIIKGGTVDAYKYAITNAHDKGITIITEKIAAIKKKMKGRKSIEYFKGLVPSLVDRGYLSQKTAKSKHAYGVSQSSPIS
jgi:hypothetical protein